MAEEVRSTDTALNADWGCILRNIVKRWWMILLAAVTAASGAYILAAEFYRPTYSATATYVVSTRGNSTTVYSNLNAASELAAVFTDILNSNVLKERVEAETGMELDATIRATLLPDTNLLDLRVTADGPEKAFFIIRSLIENHGIITSKVMENAVLQVLKAPRVPTVPDVALDNYHIAQKAALIAAAIAACIVGIVSYFSDTLKNAREAEHKIDAQFLGAIYHERKYKTLRARIRGKKQGLLITDPSVGFHFVESYKNLRTRIEHRMAEGSGKTLLVTSLMEGEGKSTVAANLALALAQKSKKVILIDCDTTAPAINELMGLSRPKDLQLRSFTLGYSGEVEPLWSKEYGMYLLPARPMRGAVEFFLGGAMEAMLVSLARKMDYIILDAPPVMAGPETECLSALAQKVLFVVQQDVARAKDVNDAIDAIEAGGAHLIGCVLNNVQVSPLFNRSEEGGA